MTELILRAGPFTFDARLETELAPKTCAAFERALPFISQAVHVRWSGEAVWLPLGDLDEEELIIKDLFAITWRGLLLLFMLLVFVLAVIILRVAIELRPTPIRKQNNNATWTAFETLKAKETAIGKLAKNILHKLMFPSNFAL